MANNKKVAKTYKDRLCMTQHEISLEQLDNTVAMGKNNLIMGISAVNSTVLGKKSAMLLAQNAVTTAKSELEAAKRTSNPNELAQKLVNAYTTVKQAEENLVAAQAEVTQAEEVMKFLETTKEELFPTQV